MEKQNVDIYCNGDLCEYDRLKIIQGYCGGPIIYNGGITAMQAGASKIVFTEENEYNDPGGCLRGDRYTDWSNCKGLTSRMTLIREIAIEFLVTEIGGYAALRVMLGVNGEFHDGQWEPIRYNWFFNAELEGTNIIHR